MRRFMSVLMFLTLVAEQKGRIYEGKWNSPFVSVGAILLDPLVKFPLLDIIAIAIVVMTLKRVSPKTHAAPMTRFIRIALLTTLCLWVWGVITGGNAYQTIWQLHPMIMMFVFSFMFMGTLKTPRDFEAIGLAIVLGALTRAAMGFIFYFIVLRTLPMPPEGLGSGFCVTTHDDTALYVTAILIAIGWAVETRKTKAILFAVVVTAWCAVAIQINNRRLAWVSLFAGFAIMYALLPKGKIRRKINKTALFMAPFLAAYIAIGWGRTEGIFKPVGSISTMFGKKEDASSETRNIENYNLIVTLRTNPIVGTGWGHEYKEVSVAYSIKDIFPQYRFIPHNSVLGLLAFTGLLGFAGVWMVFPVAAYLATRAYRAATIPALKVAAVVTVAEVAIFTNQAYGDMGFVSTTCTMMMAVAFAAAARAAVLTGGWPTAGSAKKIEAAPAPPAPSEQATV